MPQLGRCLLILRAQQDKPLRNKTTLNERAEICVLMRNGREPLTVFCSHCNEDLLQKGTDGNTRRAGGGGDELTK